MSELALLKAEAFLQHREITTIFKVLLKIDIQSAVQTLISLGRSSTLVLSDGKIRNYLLELDQALVELTQLGTLISSEDVRLAKATSETRREFLAAKREITTITDSHGNEIDYSYAQLMHVTAIVGVLNQIFLHYKWVIARPPVHPPESQEMHELIDFDDMKDQLVDLFQTATIAALRELGLYRSVHHQVDDS